MQNRLASRKLWVSIITPLVIIVAKAIGIELSDNVVMSISGVVSAYILGQAYVDSKTRRKP